MAIAIGVMATAATATGIAGHDATATRMRRPPR
jgi:hypothetical protein